MNKTNNSKLNSYTSLQVIKFAELVNTPEILEKIFNQKNAMKLISKMMSCAGGDCFDDEIISQSNQHIKSVMIKMSTLSNMNERKQQLSSIEQLIEEEGIYEEIDDQIFHSDTRWNIGVQSSANSLKFILNRKKYQINDNLDFDPDVIANIYGIDASDDEDEDEEDDEDNSE